MVIKNMLSNLSPIGGMGDALAAQAGSSNQSFYPMGMVADRNRMDAGKAPMPAPKPQMGPPPQAVVAMLAKLAQGPVAPPPPPQAYDPVAKRWYHVIDGQKVYIADDGTPVPPTPDIPPPPAEAKPEMPLINQSVMENAPWYGAEPQAPSTFQSPYAGQITDLRSQENNLLQSMIGRHAPQQSQFPLRPGAAGLALVGAILARAAGAKPDFIGQMGQGFLGSMQNANQTRYANEMAQFEQGQNDDKMRMSMLDMQLKALLDSENDANRQWNADRAFNEGVRQYDTTNDRIQSEGEANRASRLNSAEAAAIQKEAAKWLDVYNGNVSGGASRDDRNIAADNYAKLTGRVLPTVLEDSANYTAKMAGAAKSQAGADQTRQNIAFKDQTWGEQIQKIKNGLRMDESKIALSGLNVEKLRQIVENMPQKLRDDHLQAVGRLAVMREAARLSGVKADKGGFAPPQAKEARASIANQANAIRTVMSNNSNYLSSLQSRLVKATAYGSQVTPEEVASIRQEITSYEAAQKDLKAKLSDVVGVDLTGGSDQAIAGMLQQWATNPNKALQDINGGMAARASTHVDTRVDTPGSEPMTKQYLDDAYKAAREDPRAKGNPKKLRELEAAYRQQLNLLKAHKK